MAGSRIGYLQLMAISCKRILQPNVRHTTGSFIAPDEFEGGPATEPITSVVVDSSSPFPGRRTFR